MQAFIQFDKFFDERINITVGAGLVGERNDAWVRQLPKLMSEQPCFVVVGALHLAGENGLVALLRKAGYKVKPVKNGRR
ncbi:MAG: TraB/GumN family protein [Paludibacteraceae bacterium]